MYFQQKLMLPTGSIVGTLDQYGQKITKEAYTRESKIIPDWLNLKTLSLTSS